MRPNICIPFIYRTLIFNIFSMTSCLIISTGALIGVLTHTLVLTTLLGIVLAVLYEGLIPIPGVPSRRDDTDLGVILTIPISPFSRSELRGNLQTFKEAFHDAVQNNYTVHITLPKLSQGTPIAQGIRAYAEHHLTPITISYGTHTTSLLNLQFKTGPTTQYIHTPSLAELNRRITILEALGWAPTGTVTITKFLFSRPQYSQQFQYKRTQSSNESQAHRLA